MPAHVAVAARDAATTANASAGGTTFCCRMRGATAYAPRWFFGVLTTDNATTMTPAILRGARMRCFVQNLRRYTVRGAHFKTGSRRFGLWREQRTYFIAPFHWFLTLRFRISFWFVARLFGDGGRRFKTRRRRAFCWRVLPGAHTGLRGRDTCYAARRVHTAAAGSLPVILVHLLYLSRRAGMLPTLYYRFSVPLSSVLLHASYTRLTARTYSLTPEHSTYRFMLVHVVLRRGWFV